MKEKQKIALVIAIIAIVLMLIAEPPRKFSFSTILGMLVFGSVCYGVAFFLVGLFYSTKKGEDLINSRQEKKEIEEIKNQTRQNIITHKEAKSSFSYFSDERLLNLYDISIKSGKEDMERLALEEVLVERKLISHSPMHEKMHLLKQKFNL